MGNNSGKEQHEPGGTPPDQTATPTGSISPISLSSSERSHSLIFNPTNLDSDPLPEKVPSPCTVIPVDCSSPNATGNGNPLVSPKKPIETISFFRRRQNSTCATPVQVESKTAGRGSEGTVEVGLLQDCAIALGLIKTDEGSHTPTDLLRLFLNEREKMKGELKIIKEKLQSERREWLQFQSDLQVALVVADRLRAEAEEELSLLRETHQDLERQLADAKKGQQMLEGQKENLKTEVKESRESLMRGNEAPKQQRVTDEHLKSSPEKQRANKEIETEQKGGKEIGTKVKLKPTSVINTVANGPSQLSLTQTTESANKVYNSAQERLSSDQQDNLINLYKADKKEDSRSLILSAFPVIDLSPNKSSKTKPPDDFNKLLRRHGGSKRNSMLRWCQNRTNGYENIEITNFRSSWVDGLAFCAVYHSYLPSHIPYTKLRPENKKENLHLAFQTGQRVGITATLTVEEMLRTEGPDWQRVLGYVESIYQHFEM